VSERREFFRVRAFARVSLRALSKVEADRLRPTIYARPGKASALRWTDERPADGGAGAGEWHALRDVHRQLSVALERLERRIERLERATQPDVAHDAPVEISLSGAGFAGPFHIELEPDQRVWVELELPGSGLASICALARAVGSADLERAAAFHFEDIHADDREQLVQFALRIQSQSLRAEREACP
jgi:PilZ domain